MHLFSSGNQVLDKEEFGTLIKDEQVGSSRAPPLHHGRLTWKLQSTIYTPFRKAHDLRNLPRFMFHVNLHRQFCWFKVCFYFFFPDCTMVKSRCCPSNLGVHIFGALFFQGILLIKQISVTPFLSRCEMLIFVSKLTILSCKGIIS